MGLADVAAQPEEARVFLNAVREAAYDSGAKAAREEIAGARDRGEIPPKVLDELRRPFAPAAVKWKIQVELGNAALIVAHLDARLVIERLNHVVGMSWADAYRPMSTNWQWCDLTVLGVTRTDCGTGNDGKAQVSDALKRAGVKFGIGVSIYAMAVVQLRRGDGENELRYRKGRKKKDNKWTDTEVPTLDKKTLGWLAGAYERWITDGAGKVFGEALSHGDQEGAMGLEEGEGSVEPEGAEEEAEVVALEGEAADELRQTAKDAYDSLRERGEMLPGEFNRRLTAAGGSLEELEAFASELVDQAAKEPEGK